MASRTAALTRLAFGLVFWASVVLGQSRNLLTNEDVMRMARLKFDDTTIIKTIQLSDANFDLTVAALVKLKDQGVSQTVIQAMLAEGSPKRETASDKVTDPQSAAAKLQPGTYRWTGREWLAMQSISMSGGGGKHMAKMLVPGLTPQMVWTFHDGRAPIQLRDGKPLFCVKLMVVPAGTPYAPNGRNLTIVKFDEKSDRRELQVTSGGNFVTYKAGVGKNRLPEIEISEISAGTFLVSPKEELSSGEYLITQFAMAGSGYDFGFHPGKN